MVSKDQKENNFWSYPIQKSKKDTHQKQEQFHDKYKKLTESEYLSRNIRLVL